MLNYNFYKIIDLHKFVRVCKGVLLIISTDKYINKLLFNRTFPVLLDIILRKKKIIIIIFLVKGMCVKNIRVNLQTVDRKIMFFVFVDKKEIQSTQIQERVIKL